MTWVAVAVAGAAVVGGVVSSDSARKAANTQKDASQSAIAEQQYEFDKTQANQAPFLTQGTAAVNQLGDLMGTSGNQGAPGYGSLNKKFSLADFWSDPVTMASYQSGLDLGTKSLQNAASARGSLNSGGQLKALDRFATDYTGQQAAGSQARYVADQTNTFNRLSGLAGTGQTAATNLGQTGQVAASNIGNLLTAQGNARGAAAIAQGNAYGNAFNTSANAYSQQQTLNALMANNQNKTPDQTYYIQQGQ